MKKIHVERDTNDWFRQDRTALCGLTIAWGEVVSQGVAKSTVKPKNLCRQCSSKLD